MTLVSLLLLCLGARAYDIEVVVSSAVRGAHYPIAQNGSECSLEAYERSPCECDGGVARRAAAIAARREEALLEGKDAVVAFDMGGWFFGSGLFHPTFGDAAANELYRSLNFQARGLNPRDFAAGVTADEPTGGKALAEHLASTGSVAIASNLDLTDDPYLNTSHVRKFSVFTLFDDVRMGVYHMIDGFELENVSPHYAARTIGYERAVSFALSEMTVSVGIPDVHVIMVSSISDATLEGIVARADDDTLFFVDDDYLRDQQITYSFALNFVLPDLIFLDGTSEIGQSYAEEDRLQTFENWALNKVGFAVTDSRPRGVALMNMTMSFNSVGQYQPDTSSRGVIELNCESPEDTSIREELDDLKATVDQTLADPVLGHVGYLTSTLDATQLIQDADCTTLLTSETPLCGCEVAECQAGDFVADALRWYADADVAFVAAGALGASLGNGAVTKADIINLVPDLGDEIVVLRNVLGRSIREALQRSIERLDVEAPHIDDDDDDDYSSDSLSLDVYNGRYFLQVSSSVETTWFFLSEVPTIDNNILIDGIELDDNRNYSVAGSCRLFTNMDDTGSIYADIFEDADVVELGVAHWSAVSAYMQTFYPTEDIALDATTAYNIAGGFSNSTVPARISQESDEFIKVHVAVLCGGSIVRREQCDHALNAIALLNDRDGSLYNQLVPNVRLVAHDVAVGCVEGRAFDGLVALASTLDGEPISLVIPTCSDDVAAVSSTDALAAFAAQTGQSEPYVVVTPEATSPSFSDEVTYPYLVRVATSKTEVGAAMSKFAESYWARIIVVHDDTRWSQEGAQAFVDKFRSDEHFILGGGICISGANYTCGATTKIGGENVGVAFSLEAFDAGDVTGTDILESVASLGSNIVFIATYPRVQEQIYAASYKTGLMHGAGYGWLNFYPSEDAFFDSAGNVELDAIFGHEGAVGFIEHMPVYADGQETELYIDAWVPRASVEACTDRSIVAGTSLIYEDGQLAEYGEASENDFVYVSADRTLYCDVDGDPYTIYGYGAFWFDSVVVYTLGLDGFMQSSSNAEIASADDFSAAGIYANLLEIEQFGGVSGFLILSNKTGDRLGTIDMNNMQVTNRDYRRRRRSLEETASSSSSEEPPLVGAAREQLVVENFERAVELRSSFAEFVIFGEYDVSDKSSTVKGTVVWPGRTTSVPVDYVTNEDALTYQDKKNSTSFRRTLIFFLVLAGVVFVMVLACVCISAGYVFRLQDFRHRKALVASLRAYEVVEPFDPEQHEEKTVHVLEKRGTEDIFGKGDASTLITAFSFRNEAENSKLPFATSDDIPGWGDAQNTSSPSSSLHEDVKDQGFRRGGATAGGIFKLEMWWWEEDNERLKKKDEAKNVDASLDDDDGVESAWVAYDEMVQDQLSELYWRFCQLPEAVREELKSYSGRNEELDSDDGDDEMATSDNNVVAGVEPIDYTLIVRSAAAAAAATTTNVPEQPSIDVLSVRRTSSRDPDFKAELAPSTTTTATNGKWFEINVATMTQRNLKTGRCRKVRMDPDSREVEFTWYWRENFRNMAKWRNAATRSGTLWVRYEDPHVQRKLSEAYLARRRHETKSSAVKIDAFNELTTSAIEYKYEIDVGTMWQTKIETGFRRPVCVMMEATRDSNVRTPGGSSALVKGVPTVKGMPRDIQGRECLTLTTGMLVSVVYEHDGGEWAFGREIHNMNEVLDNAGWFPMSCVKECDQCISIVPDTTALRDFKFLLPPKSWTAMGNESRCNAVELGTGRATAKERAEILRAFDPNYYNIISVERIQNVSLWRPYATKRMTILEREGLAPDRRLLKDNNGFDPKVEVFPVYHGTTGEAAGKIVEQGFNRDFCSTSAQHGRGVYFAVEADYSCFPKYSPPDKDGIQNVFVCRIIVGHYTKGVAGAVVPPALEGNPNQRYDTTVDNEVHPTIFVTYNDHQAYPAYLVRFTSKTEDVHDISLDGDASPLL
ncbi:hypothetical protein CTAYLR_008075 [Chrysophaeum taylorii]|uniref:Poly [ADP-ribose] polymerase n=1 Tax=Chrysophaeum taylorii TaxID=2483200 RepID=A0AAD7UK27_9STRA|nr:hypothetical protein CTAYLR_008075 [Chrysophaeum taylorii]